MKKILLILSAGIVIMSCNGTDKTAESSNTAVTSETTVTADHSSLPNTSDVQASSADTSKITKVEWLDGIERDFGNMKEGDKLDVIFRVKNVGNKPLIISSVTPGCGCTLAEKPEKPVAPGETGNIKAVFNSSGQGAGAKTKSLTVLSNTDPQMTSLVFHVEVKAKS